jgi:peroxiredoxin Q/BCP
MLGIGDQAPDFPIPRTDGNTRTLASYRGRPVILYFFPKANTTGCTIETRGFAQRYDSFQRAGFEVVGVSVDSVETQAGFAEKCSARFPIVSDRSKEIARNYGVLGLLGWAKRVSFLVGADGRIRDVVESLLPDPHLRAAEKWLTLSVGSSPNEPSGSGPKPGWSGK